MNSVAIEIYSVPRVHRELAVYPLAIFLNVINGICLPYKPVNVAKTYQAQLPREKEALGRVLDGRSLWEAIKTWPGEGRAA